MTANQSGWSSDMNTANSSSNWKVDRRTRDIEIRHHTGVKGKTGAFARRNLTHGYQITGAKHPIFVGPIVPREPPNDLASLCEMKKINCNAPISICYDKFKQDNACPNPAMTTGLNNALAPNINHGCPGCAQATFIVAETYDITLTLEKDVTAGEEILIDFSQARSRLRCSLCHTKESLNGNGGNANSKNFSQNLTRTTYSGPPNVWNDVIRT
ncbi:uncharacterized protein FFMR_01247 [Fusarium fujikuroi]|nr:uncharacterized protein FFMR_01247 [Fusarium fujikuroi]